MVGDWLGWAVGDAVLVREGVGARLAVREGAGEAARVGAAVLRAAAVDAGAGLRGEKMPQADITTNSTVISGMSCFERIAILGSL